MTIQDLRNLFFCLLIITSASAAARTDLLVPGQGAILPDRFEASFELRSQLIFMKAALNGKECLFILDSGAPTIVLNSDNKLIKIVSKKASTAIGVGGKIETGKTHVDSFEWCGLKMTDFDAITMSLNHLEKQAKCSFVGLIGYSIFKDYELTFDYRRKTVTFSKVDDNGNIIGEPETSALPLVIVPIRMDTHIPVFQITIAGKNYKMGLDCGAGVNLFYQKHVVEIEHELSDYRATKDGYIRGIAEKSTATNT